MCTKENFKYIRTTENTSSKLRTYQFYPNLKPLLPQKVYPFCIKVHFFSTFSLFRNEYTAVTAKLYSTHQLTQHIQGARGKKEKIDFNVHLITFHALLFSDLQKI